MVFGELEEKGDIWGNFKRIKVYLNSLHRKEVIFGKGNKRGGICRSRRKKAVKYIHSRQKENAIFRKGEGSIWGGKRKNLMFVEGKR